MMAAPLYLEDLAVGQKFGSSSYPVTKGDIEAFARAFDPQPFHVDGDAAEKSFFRGQAASGWHTASITMRLVVESELQLAGGIVGASFDEFRWTLPVRPGDVLHVESEVIDVTPSKSRPTQGIAKMRITTLNQDNRPVQLQISNLIVQRRSVISEGQEVISAAG
jgi:acyl dehydratase